MIWVVVGDLVPALVEAVVYVHVQADAVVAVNLGHVVVEGAPVLEGILDGHKVLVGVGEPVKCTKQGKISEMLYLSLIHI